MWLEALRSGFDVLIKILAIPPTMRQQSAKD
jgi:hypothetical protein